MTHHFICKHCKSENEVSISESDRGAYQMKHGDFKDTTCSHCLRKEKTHINDVYGKISRKMMITGFIIGLALTIFLLFALPNIIIITSAIISFPTIILVYENSIVKTFNNYRIRKK